MNPKKLAFKKRIYEIIEAAQGGDRVSKVYDTMIMTCVIVGMVPLVLKRVNSFTWLIDLTTLIVFMVDYILRIYTSDYKMGYFSYKAYLWNLFSPMEVIDFLSILPIVCFFVPSTSGLQLIRLFRIARIFKLARYSKTINSISNVLRRVGRPLVAVFALAFVYIIITGIIMFQLEPQNFDSFIDAFYWASISLSGVGYGDITPVTTVGKIISSISSLVGVAVIALPTGIITAAYTREISKVKGKNEL